MKRVCVFCGSSSGGDPAYAEAAAELGGLLARRGVGLVYGGASVGLMGILADAALAAGAEVIGVIPAALTKYEIAHAGLSDLHVVGSMHERKAMMAELADGFVALPGGLGTLDEFFEVLTWAQLGLHAKPCGVLNTRGFYDPLLAFLDRAVEQRFLRPENRDILIARESPESLLDAMDRYVAQPVDKWIDRTDV